MKSNVCKIDKGTQDLEAIFKESEKVAIFNGLTHKQTLQLRLLCEELDGMLPKIIGDFNGQLWIEFAEGVCKVHASIELDDITLDKKNELVNVAKNKKNAAAVGIVGKIRSALENFLMSDESMGALDAASGAFYMSTNYSEGVNYAYLWSLEQYKSSVNKEEQTEAWDELEKSVIASVADDVIVGVKGKQADITIVKKFA
jgi:hypothetical protein